MHMHRICKDLNIVDEQTRIVGMKKSKWKELCKEKISEEIRVRLKRDITGKTKARFVQQDEWKRKEYIDNEDGYVALAVLKIRLNMWPLRMNFKKDNESWLCPKCGIADDTTEHVIKCYTELDDATLMNSSTNTDWREIVTVFRNNEKDRESLET